MFCEAMRLKRGLDDLHQLGPGRLFALQRFVSGAKRDETPVEGSE